MSSKRKRIGVIGYGHLGQHLVSNILRDDRLELAFVWNRNQEVFKDDVDDELILDRLENFTERRADLIVEVAHPDVTRQYGERILSVCDYMVGSPTALADETMLSGLQRAADRHGLYVPSGALWGGEDIQKMADLGTLQKLQVTMTIHPDSLKLIGELKEKNAAVTERTVLYDGCVRGLCGLAPNNVNTMAAAALAGHNLGFDGVRGCLVSDPGLPDWHIVEVDVWGRGDIEAGTAFHVHTTKRNPSQRGHVTGSATLAAFYASMLRAFGKGPGIHLC